MGEIPKSASNGTSQSFWAPVIAWLLVSMLWCGDALANSGSVGAEEQAAGIQAQSGKRTNPSAHPSGKAKWEWDFGWHGWDGLHYDVLTEHGKDWYWTKDQEQPPFPSLFLDRFRLNGKFGARLDLDAAGYVPADNLGPVANRVVVRRWRLYTSGDAIALVPFSYTLSVMAVTNTNFVLDDTYLEFKRIPYLGTFKFGAFSPRMGLEQSASSREATFMEWSTAVQALAPRLSAGWQLSRPILGNRATWSFGGFAQGVGIDVGDATRDFVRAVGRTTWLPYYQPAEHSGDGVQLLHVGLNASFLYSGNASIRYQTRPESRMAPFMADTGDVDARDMASYGLELAWVDGPWSLQGEYLSNHVTTRIDQHFYGFYAAGSYFLTGENRHYDTAQGYFVRLRPNQDFSFTGGSGAVEAAVRFSYVDLSDGPVKGGILRSVTAGLNWYLHSHSKLRFNYVFASASGGLRPGDLHVFESRFEFDF